MKNKPEHAFVWYTLALTSFSIIWGFGNAVNNYANQGLEVVTSWVIITLIYFIPYTLIVAELGTAFKDQNQAGGVSDWIKYGLGSTIAFICGWIYWVVRIPYLAQKPQNVLVAFGWIFKQNGDLVKDVSPILLQSMILVIFLLFVWLASRGVVTLKRIGTLAGMTMFIMGILYVLMMLAAPVFNSGVEIATKDWSLSSWIPSFDFRYFTTIAMLVFAVGGAEQISPYIANTRNPGKELPKAMISVAAMVALSAILGSIALGMMFDTNNIPNDLKMNGQYYAFELLGEYYGVGKALLVLYAVAQALGQISAMMLSIDAPLKVLIGLGDNNFIPRSLTKVNKHGAPINGYILTAILVSILIIIPAFGIDNMNSLYNWLLDLNAIVMPLGYLLVFIAYIGIRGYCKKPYHSEYTFIKNDKLATAVGWWCFLFTAFACLMGIFPKVEAFTAEWFFQIALNVLTPIVLIGIGFILPRIAKWENKKYEQKQLNK